jgi:hypothetical protein
VQRGVSLCKLIDRKPTFYPLLEPPRRFAAVNEVLRKLPVRGSSIPPVRQIQFVQPVYSKPPERVDFVSRINLAEPRKAKLKRLIQDSEKQELQFQNDMIQFLNHANERRLRASEKFFDDMSQHGLKRAQLNAKRATQRSRLRVRCHTDWWEEFIAFAFSARVGREEERFIEGIARKPHLSFKEYYEMLREFENHPEGKERCIELLKWINAKCKFADEDIIKILKADEARSKAAFSARTTGSRA